MSKDKPGTVTPLPHRDSKDVYKKMMAEAGRDRKKTTEAEKLVHASEGFFKQSGEFVGRRLEEMEAPSPTLPDTQINTHPDTHTEIPPGEPLGVQVGEPLGSQLGVQEGAPSGASLGEQLGGWEGEVPDLHLPLTQAKVLAFLCSLKRLFTNGINISRATQIPLGTVKDGIQMLKQKGYIRHTRVHREGNFRGFIYELDQSLCQRYFSAWWSLADRFTYANSPLRGPVGAPVGSPVGDREGVQLPPLSSRSSLESSTREGLQAALEGDPELRYWKSRGLTTNQLEVWLREFQLPLEVLVQDLRHCAFEMNDLGMEARRQVEKPLSYFYTVMKEVGHYPMPKGYKSHRQKIQERAEECRRLQEAEEQGYLDDCLDIILGDPEGELYQRCWEAIPENQRRFCKPGSQSLRAAMGKQLRELIAAEGKVVAEELI